MNLHNRFILIWTMAFLCLFSFPTPITANSQINSWDSVNEAIQIFRTSPLQATKTLIYISEESLTLNHIPQLEPWQVELNYDQATKILNYKEKTYGQLYKERLISDKDLSRSPYHNFSLINKAKLTGMVSKEGLETYYFHLEEENLEIKITLDPKRSFPLTEAKFLWNFPKENQYLLHHVEL